ncbi:outer membrane beta-barrel protein [Shewanella gaetbuli]|uniref:Porin family protein n=1 Tax=Shewanella gaetbuli TaxID=220752 RepID=A0A9X1ZIG5_9GAMM|nr:outer membrane beta-barrel protein [Shewanella gaetbuli]MCL1141597.1 porin family protein [Shewanella gaetbuli]
MLSKSVIIAALCLTCLPAVAQTTVPQQTEQQGFYVGGLINNMELDLKEINEDAVGVGIYGGYRFNAWLGVEANLSDGINFIDVSLSTTSIAPTFIWQFNPTFSGLLKVGPTYIRSAAGLSGYKYKISNHAEFTGVGVVYGVGLNASITDHLVIRAMYERSEGKLESDIQPTPDFTHVVQQLSIGLHYQF